MSHAWMPLYVGDYLGKTQRLSLAEHGAYMLLIMEYWQSRGLPDDDAQLARICRVTDKEWKKVRPAIAPFFGEGWRHARVEEELAKADAKHMKRVSAGKSGGDAKASADANGRHKPSKQPSIAKADAMASSSQSPSPEEATQPVAKPREETQPSPALESDGVVITSEEIIPEPNSSNGLGVVTSIEEITPEYEEIPSFLRLELASRKAELDAMETALREAAGLQNDPSPSLMDLSPIVALIDKGWDLAGDILPVIRAKARPGVRTWRYFVPAIEQSKTANERIAAKPEAVVVAAVGWVHTEQPEWGELAERFKRERGKPPPAMGSRAGLIGQGWYFPAEWIAELRKVTALATRTREPEGDEWEWAKGAAERLKLP